MHHRSQGFEWTSGPYPVFCVPFNFFVQHIQCLFQTTSSHQTTSRTWALRSRVISWTYLSGWPRAAVKRQTRRSAEDPDVLGWNPQDLRIQERGGRTGRENPPDLCRCLCHLTVQTWIVQIRDPTRLPRTPHICTIFPINRIRSYVNRKKIILFFLQCCITTFEITNYNIFQ